jgi:hypothetical protein
MEGHKKEKKIKDVIRANKCRRIDRIYEEEEIKGKV